MYSLEKREQSVLTDISFCLSELVAFGAGQLNTVSLFLSMGSKMDFLCCSRRSFSKVLYCYFPVASAFRNLVTASDPRISLVWSATRSSVSSRKGLPISSIAATNAFTSFRNAD